MKWSFWHQIVLIATVFIGIETVYAIPAPKGLIEVEQPDGTLLSVYMKGDEFFHYAVSTDGYVLLPDKRGFYTYAVKDSSGELKPGMFQATEEALRDQHQQTFLKTIRPGSTFSDQQLNNSVGRRYLHAIQQKPALRSSNETTGTEQINDYPTQGTIKSVVILVNFSDVSFNTPLPQEVFNNLQNLEGYNEGLHIGSVRDYYVSNSEKTFTPEFVVVGPVTLSNSMAYYGANDEEGQDLHPAQMVKDACLAANSLVDYSQFDADNDGYVDNVYVYYAGKGEADGGSANTIWPHSWGISGEGYKLTLDNKKIEYYACSAELNGSGNLTGIGVFSHEYGHLLGLKDMYDVDYDDYNGQAFGIGEWSLMAYGSYNGRGSVPPCLSLLERTQLGWADPMLLNEPSDVTLPSLESSNTGYIIQTDNQGEYFLLENRQQTPGTWEAYLPHHGMLVYHIDKRSNATIELSYFGETRTWSFARLWDYNMVNAIATHQCADIEEADNSGSLYNVKGDPFPGTSSNRSFSDNTNPSMKTWDGTSLNMPLTSITEKDNLISFEFMGGLKIMSIPASYSAQGIRPFSFTARWSPVDKAEGYYLDVFLMDVSANDTLKTYVTGYEHCLVLDTFKVINVPSDLTAYYYQVRATNGFTTSEYSDIICLTTSNSLVSVKPATDVTPFTFSANWKNENWATGYYLTVYELVEWTGDLPTLMILSDYDRRFVTDSTLVVNELDSERTYFYSVEATDNVSIGKRSDKVSLTTGKATEVVAYVRNRTIYLKGIDSDSPVRLYDPSGQLKQISTTNVFEATHGGLYFVEVWLDGVRNILKIQVQ